MFDALLTLHTQVRFVSTLPTEAGKLWHSNDVVHLQ
jgi:hypothetical protein